MGTLVLILNIVVIIIILAHASVQNHCYALRTNFDDFYSAHKYVDPNWLTWFIGFSEGNGGLHTYNNNLIFGLTQKEEPILQEIHSV